MSDDAMHTVFLSGEPDLTTAVRELSKLLSSPQGQNQFQNSDFCRDVIDRLHQIYTEEILLKSNNGYVTFHNRHELSQFLIQTEEIVSCLKKIKQYSGADVLDINKKIVYYYVIAMNAATYKMNGRADRETRERWDNDIDLLEAEILKSDPSYTVPTTELFTNQHNMLVAYWNNRREQYFRRMKDLERTRNQAASSKLSINIIGAAFLAIPLLTLFVLPFTHGLNTLISLVLGIAFVILGIMVYVFESINKNALNQVKELENQGIGQLGKELNPDIYIICGHYGSGKTTFATNLAEDFAVRKGKKVALCDLDVVNPYFRSSDYTDRLTKKGITVISPNSAGTTIDAPTISSDIYSAFSGKYDTVIFDVGGDDAGATALGQFQNELSATGYRMIYVINFYREQIEDPADAEQILREIEAACHLKATEICNNSHLCGETTAETVLRSLPYAKEVSSRLGLPVTYTTVDADVSMEGTTVPTLFTVERLVLPPWGKD